MTKHLHSCEEFSVSGMWVDLVSASSSDPVSPARSRHQPAVSLDHVAFRYGGKAEILHDINVLLPTGSFHYLYGDTGAGKSTLLRLMATDLSPTRGVFHLFGQEVRRVMRQNLVAIRRHIGFQMQDCALIAHMNVFDNIALPLHLHGHPDATKPEYVHELLAWMGLGDLAQASPATLSPGIRQNIALARALIHRPALLLLDEPLAWQDDRLVRRTMHLLATLNDQGTSIVLATRDARLIQRFPYPCLWLQSGSVRMLGLHDLHHIINLPPASPPAIVTPPATTQPDTPAVRTPPPAVPHDADEAPAPIPDWPDYEQLLSPLRHIERWRR